MPDYSASDVLSAVTLLLVALVLWFGPFVASKRRERQARLDLMHFNPPVVRVRSSWTTIPAPAYIVLARLEFCPRKDAFGEPKPEDIERVEVVLTFQWYGSRKRYSLKPEDITNLSLAVKRRGIGRKWDKEENGKFLKRVEDDVAAAIL